MLRRVNRRWAITFTPWSRLTQEAFCGTYFFFRSFDVKHLEGSLWEMRMQGKDGISRAIYVTARGRRVVVVRVFVKKTEKTPRQEIDLARERAKGVKP